MISGVKVVGVELLVGEVKLTAAVATAQADALDPGELVVVAGLGW